MIRRYSELLAQDDAFFHREWETAHEEAVREIVREFSNRKGVAGRDKDGKIEWVLSLSTKMKDHIQLTLFDQNQDPVADTSAPFSKKGLLKLIEDNGLTRNYIRKDMPDSAGLGKPEGYWFYFYRLRLRDVSPGAVPSGFVDSDKREVTYNRMLSYKEICDFELEPIGFEEQKCRHP